MPPQIKKRVKKWMRDNKSNAAIKDLVIAASTKYSKDIINSSVYDENEEYKNRRMRKVTYFDISCIISL